ncbi:sel1 repeat family protein [Clostridiaceae bacterium]|nr:sel1 repeat family protein [Clostridiaceae bacterium]
MAKLIFTSRYIRDTPPEHLQNYVRYISTREGVEKADESKKNLPATSAQKDLIRQLLKDMPESKDMLEYEDYCRCSTIGNASEFITQAMERNLDMAAMKENYVDYLANRPRVERIGEHGLFTDAGRPVILSEVQKEVSGHKGPVWTHVVSLRREDAARLGYDSAREWMALLRSKRAMLSRHMKIDSADLRWYAAFHNEGHHPHVHLMVYSAKDNDGFLTKAGIEAMRSELAHDIFRQDFAQIYEGQNLARSSLKEKAAERMCLLADSMLQGVCENPIIGEKLQQLSRRLKNTGGKKVYGYLKADVKRLVDQIVDELAKDPAVSEAYRAWGEWQDQIRLTYSSKAPPLPPLSSQKQLKSIKNMVIAEALKLGGHHFLSETSGQEKIQTEARLDELEERILDGSEEIEETEIELETETEPVSADAESMLEAEELLSEPELDVPGLFEGKEKTSAKAEWSRQYKLARSYLYGSKKVPQDFQEAMRLFCQEAERGNALAMYDLGRMWADGLGVEADPDAAREWYRKALNAFLSAEKELPERKKTYLQYRIGKMYLAGLGTEQDYETAALWLERAAEKSHKCAQYTLAGLYVKGQGVEKDLKHAFELYHASAIQGNPYASYEMAKMFRDGTGTKKSAGQAKEHFQDAFSGFQVLEEQSHDDKLQYRLGQMLYQGIGTERDEEEAVRYWQQAAKLGNVNAQYALGKFWLDTRTGDVHQAAAWLEKAADAGKTSAQYVLAKLYLEGCQGEKDVEKAGKLFQKAAEQGNGFAAYRLGRLYLEGEEIPKDMVAAVRWLTEAAEQELPFAQYTLGCLYLKGEEIPKDMGKAVAWLRKAALQGNEYAQYALGKLFLYGQPGMSRDKEKAVPLMEAAAAQGNVYAQFLLENLDSFRDPDLILAATRLMHHLSRIFQEDYRKASGGSGMGHIDRRRRRKLQEKRMAQGHKKDDHEPQQSM